MADDKKAATPKRSPARAIRSLGDAELKKLKGKMENLSGPIGPAKAAALLKAAKAGNVNLADREKAVDYSKTLLPIVKDEIKKRDKTMVAKKKMRGGGMAKMAKKKMMRGGSVQAKKMRGGGMPKMAKKKMMRGGVAKKK